MFKYTKCDICQQHVGKTSLKLLNTFSGPKQDKTDHGLILFDCSKVSSYNHAFHDRCLKRAIKEELQKDKKASLQRANLDKHARCIICYKQSQKIEGLGAQAQKADGSTQSRRRGGRHRDRSATPNRQAIEL